MSRRNQSRRRRTYGRRQHEVRERQADPRGGVGWSGSDSDYDTDWKQTDAIDERARYGESFGGFSR